MVNIFEQPVKPVVDLEDSITVYVPGYSYFGPGDPTLVSSVAEFEGLFGSTPYLFEANQTTSEINKGSPEKGYLYAKSLLQSGLKVLFHRYKATGIKTAEAEVEIKPVGIADLTSYFIKVKAISFGKGYEKTGVTLTKKQGNVCGLKIYQNCEEAEADETQKVYEGNVSLDPNSPLYIGLINLPLIKIEVDDSTMLAISGANYTIEEGLSILTFPTEGTSPIYEFYLDDSGSGSSAIKGLLSSLADPAGMMYPLGDFERYPSVCYITSGGYYTNVSVAGNQLSTALKINAIALIDLNLSISDYQSWDSAKATLTSIPGSSLAKGKGAFFVGCNSFNLSPYRIILGDSFNYLKSLGEDLKMNIRAWVPVANDPNGVSPLGYATTQKIDTELSMALAEGNLGVSANPLIYSTSAGGYKIMGNRTLLNNDGVLSPNSFLNVSVVVNRVERAARQTANKLKIKSTDPKDTFNKFKTSMAKTIDPMVVTQDGVLSYKIKMLPKTKPATIDIGISLVVVEGLETFNIYLNYEIALD